MPDSVSSVKTSSPAQIFQGPQNVSYKSSPKGISSGNSSIQSAGVHKSKNIFEEIKDSVTNIVSSIKHLILSIFYRIFYCKMPPTQNELKYSDFKARMDRVNDLSPELALKEANEFPIVFTLLGQEVFKKSNIAWKIYVGIPLLLGIKTYYEIGREESLKDPRTLIPTLQEYYLQQSATLERKIKHEQN